MESPPKHIELLTESVKESLQFQKETKKQQDEANKETQAEIYRFGLIMSRVEQQIITINERGCTPGATMYEDVHNKLDKKITAVHKRVDDHKTHLWIVGSIGSIVAAAVATMMQYIGNKP